MVRWEPDAYGRLRTAALELFAEQGFEKTTVAQIAERAGLNRRTFFHHFADKREVVFASEDARGDDERLAAAIREHPEPDGPLPAAVAGIKTMADPYEQYREGAIRLGAVIAASPELRERELVKRAALAGKIAAALRERGTAEGPATVTAWAAVALFFVARNRWNQPGNVRTLSAHIDDAATEFRGATAP